MSQGKEQLSRESLHGTKSRKKSRDVLANLVTGSTQVGGQLTRESSEEILNKHNIKKLSSWFHTWQSWQKRLLICTVMNRCTKQQLAVLATSLEPILHMDFSSSLLPPLQSLHLDSVATFHVQRVITKKMVKPEVAVPPIDSQAYLTSLPSTFNSSHIISIRSSTSDTYSAATEDPQGLFSSEQLTEPAKSPMREKKEFFLPVLPLTHPDHLPTPGLAREASFHQLLDYRRQRFSSVPDFRSTASLLKKCGKRWGNTQAKKSSGRALLAKSKTISAYFNQPQSWEQRTEQFKEQLGLVTDVRNMVECLCFEIRLLSQYNSGWRNGRVPTRLIFSLSW